MNTKTVIISTAATAIILIGGIVYLTNKKNVSPKSARPVATNTVEAPEEPTGDITPKKETKNPSDIASLEPAAPVQPPPLTDEETAPFDPRVAIGKKNLKTAELMLGMFKLAISMKDSTGIDIMQMGEDTDELAQKLSLRLQLTEEQKTAFQEILKENNKKQNIENKIVLEGLLEMDKEKASELLALQMLTEEELSSNPELASYSKSLEQDIANELGVDPEALNNDIDSSTSWTQNDELIDDLSAQLTPPQQTELLTYLEEQKLRKAERYAYERSSQLSNQLGLNEEDRGALYDYLSENPDATDKDIKDNLAPELRELMK